MDIERIDKDKEESFYKIKSITDLRFRGSVKVV